MYAGGDQLLAEQNSRPEVMFSMRGVQLRIQCASLRGLMHSLVDFVVFHIFAILDVAKSARVLNGVGVRRWWPTFGGAKFETGGHV